LLHSRAVPDPIIVATGRGVAAFNLADLFVLTGILSLTAALVAATIRHRDSLRPPRGWERPLRRRS
jgi:lipoprotein signal peptidase